MKYTKLFPLVVILLVSCAGPMTLISPQTPTDVVEVSGTAPVTPDPAMGSIRGNISWADPKQPVKTVNIELNGHSGKKPPRYTIKTDVNGNYSFINIEPNEYGFGVYFSIPLSERLCDNPVFSYDKDLGWLHYATWLKGELWFDIIFSSTDVKVEPGKTFVLDFTLKCP
jgi:hypothetical protein